MLNRLVWICSGHFRLIGTDKDGEKPKNINVKVEGAEMKLEGGELATNVIGGKADPPRTVFEIKTPNLCFARKRPFRSSINRQNDRQQTDKTGALC